MIYTYRKQLLIILFVLFVVVGGFVFYKISTSHTDTSGQTSTVVKPAASAPLSEASIEDINTNMTKLLTIKYGKAVASAHIRDGTYKRKSVSAHTVTTRVLIDVPEKKETYLYTSTGTATTPNITFQIHCAAEADQMVHPSACKELGNE